MSENNETSKPSKESENPKRITKEQIVEKAKREVFLRLLQINKQQKKP